MIKERKFKKLFFSNLIYKALCACGNGSYNAASKAFIKLESNESIDEKERKEFEALAFQIFSLNSPKDKKPALRGDCPQCGTHITEWYPFFSISIIIL